MVHNLSVQLPTSEAVLIDSNVLIYVHTRFPSDSRYEDKQNAYSAAIGSLLNKNIMLVTTFLSVTDVFNYIERKAFEAYKVKNNLDETFDRKKFRKLSNQRKLVQNEIFQAYNEISQYYTFRDATFKRKIIDLYATSYLQHQYDPTDFILAALAEREGISEIITDDHDFFDDSRFTIYTF